MEKRPVLQFRRVFTDIVISWCVFYFKSDFIPMQSIFFRFRFRELFCRRSRLIGKKGWCEMKKKRGKNRKWLAGVLAAAMMLTGCGAAKKLNMADGGEKLGAADGTGSGDILRPGGESDSDKKPVWPAETTLGDGGTVHTDSAAGGAEGLMDFSGTLESSAALPGEKSEEMLLPEQEEIPGIVPAPGLLTAGEWRDNLNWGFLVNLVQTGSFRFQTFGIAPYQRVVVHAVSEGKTAANMRAALYDAAGNVLAEAVTDHTGTAYLYYNVYGIVPGTAKPDHVTLITPDGQTVTEGLDGAQDSLVTVDPGQNPDGQQSMQESDVLYPENSAVILQSSELTVEVPAFSAPARRLDVMFVFDTTGSMSDELMYLQKEFEDIAAQVSDQNTRFSVNFYRDHGDDYVVRSNEFLSDITQVSALINAEYADGGGDYEEAVDLALYDAVLGHEWREEAVKLMFLILDAPPHDTEETAENLKAAVQAAASQGIRIVPIASSGVDKKTEGLLRSLSMITGGTYTFLTDDSGIGGSHLEPTIGSYTVEALNDLIVRLIREYCGE